MKETEEGTSVVYALASWDDDNPADYLMAGWWAEFPGQHLPELSFEGSIRYGIVDGPEIDPANPPALPTEGQATYVGQAGGIYSYAPGTDRGEDERVAVLDEYFGTVTLAANFSDGTLSGCIGAPGIWRRNAPISGFSSGMKFATCNPLPKTTKFTLKRRPFRETAISSTRA